MAEVVRADGGPAVFGLDGNDVAAQAELPATAAQAWPADVALQHLLRLAGQRLCTSRTRHGRLCRHNPRNLVR